MSDGPLSLWWRGLACWCRWELQRGTRHHVFFIGPFGGMWYRGEEVRRYRPAAGAPFLLLIALAAPLAAQSDQPRFCPCDSILASNPPIECPPCERDELLPVVPVSVEEIAAAERELGIATDDEPAEPALEPPSMQAPVAAAGWCALRTGKREAAAPASDEGEDAAPAAPKPPGCDVGAGVALYRWHRLSIVAVIGAETVGGGVALVAYRPPSGPAIAVALGFVMPYDAGGVYAGELAPAIGMTLSFGRPR